MGFAVRDSQGVALGWHGPPRWGFGRVGDWGSGWVVDWGGANVLSTRYALSHCSGWVVDWGGQMGG